jgi:hypothetical protein
VTVTKIANVVAVAGAILLGACGAPSSLDLCHESCDVQKRCGTLSDAQAANCHTNCDAMKGALADKDAQDDKNCTNSAQVRSNYAACGSVDCNKVAQCIANVDNTCIQRR